MIWSGALADTSAVLRLVPDAPVNIRVAPRRLDSLIRTVLCPAGDVARTEKAPAYVLAPVSLIGFTMLQEIMGTDAPSSRLRGRGAQDWRDSGFGLATS